MLFEHIGPSFWLLKNGAYCHDLVTSKMMSSCVSVIT